MLLDLQIYWGEETPVEEDTGGYKWKPQPKKVRPPLVLEPVPLPYFECEAELVHTLEVEARATVILHGKLQLEFLTELEGLAAPGVGGTIEGEVRSLGDAAALQSFGAEATWGYGSATDAEARLGFRASSELETTLTFKSRDPQINEDREILMLLGLL